MVVSAREAVTISLTLTFDQIKRNLNKGRYVRVDRFQEDMFKVFDRARQLSRTDSQLYEDAVEMQLFFIKIRDELCKNGEILLTPALSYTEKHLQAALEAEKKEKLPKEQQDEEKKRNLESDEKIASASNGLEPHIMCIEKLFHDNAGLPALHGNWFYRPNETFHLATRKFLEKEVFKSEFSTTIPLSQLLGPKCYVMFVKDYFKMKPQGFADKDVYVCESRYNARHKAFKKIKVWQVPASESVKLNAREHVVSPVRVASVFADKSKETEKDDLDDGGTFNVLDKNRENVELEMYGPEYAGSVYYEQYNTPSGCYKLGDCVHIKSTEEKPFIARIDKIWVTAGGNIFFYGPLFVRPSDVEHSPTRMFYCREVFYSCKETSFPAMTVIGRCAVLHIKDYCSYRITEVPEQNVYICESKYLETERSIRKLAKGLKVYLKKYSLSPKVTDDELYFFKKHIVPQKEPSPLLPEAVDTEELEDEEKLEYPVVTTPNKSLNVSYEETPLLPEKPNRKEGGGGTADRSRKVNGSPSKSNTNIRRQPSGYIVFAGEIRKQIQQENPDCSFGDISRIVGTKWRNLNKDEKEKFEEKAKKIAEEQAAKQEAAEKAFNESLNPQSPWSDYSRSMSPAAGTAGTMPNGQPIPGNFQNQFGFQAFQGGQQMAPPPQPRPPSPIFVAVPPRTQRLLHSEAYIRYIEGLNSNSRCVSDWNKTLTATPETVSTQSEKRLPTHWMSHGSNYHGSITNALWALRDLMLKDTLNITRTLPFDDL
ncbi:protein polybromo-1-like isoform X6 [Octopus vulgaris]|uniref:Protein polybromo-1-like isoform X6 n=1 Tax=Octopus vulgaris TaxID=6645 RepID=A0AA36FM82_OCTVU|nr:protein polybromo-1-like isoform X6 [Octopus vulgaris]